MATQDIPVIVDYILAKTGKGKLQYAGHSQGTIVFFTASAVFGEKFTNKIEKFVGFAPVIYLSHVNFGLSIIADEMDLMNQIVAQHDVILQFS